MTARATAQWGAVRCTTHAGPVTGRRWHLMPGHLLTRQFTNSVRWRNVCITAWNRCPEQCELQDQYGSDKADDSAKAVHRAR